MAAAGHDLWLLNRGNRKDEVPENVKQVIADIDDEETDPDSIFLKQMLKFPGTGTDHPLQPGGSVVIAAKSAQNHLENATVSVDLSGADFEVKAMEGSGNPAVPMMPSCSPS